MNKFLLFFILVINSGNCYLKGENINPFTEKNFLLTNTDFYKIYNLYPRISDFNHEIIFQINSNYNGIAKLCTGYFQNKNEENINYKSYSNEFINCQKVFNINIIDNFEEYNITYDFNSEKELNSNGYYFIALYIDKKNGQEFSGTITTFVTNKIIQIEQDILSKYFILKNNYLSKNYSFIIFPNKSINQSLHIQIASLNEKNLFNISIENQNNYLIEEKSNIFSFNDFFNPSNDEEYFTLNIFFLNNSNLQTNLDFAIYFEYTSINNNIILLQDNIIEINFLVKSDYYFLQDIKSIVYKNNYFYIINDFSLKRTIATLSLSEMNFELNDLDNRDNFFKLLNSSKFSNCKSRFNGNSLNFFKCTKKANVANNSNFMIIKLSSSGNTPLKIRKLQLKSFKKILNEENIKGFYYQSFNSKYLINKIEYFYIPKSNNDTKYQLIYCSKPNSMNIYYGDYDIIEQTSEIENFEKIRLFKISHNNEDYNGNNFEGFTIITNNREENYFIQIIDINKDIYDNLLIEKINDKTKMNKEIIFNIPIKNYYIFYANEFEEVNVDIIFDVQIVYGKLDIEYIDMDSIQENDFNLNRILLFNKDDYSITNIKHPILVKKTTEFIKITNDNFDLNYYFKAKFYMNKYINNELKKWNTLIPIYLNPLESKKYSLENLYGNVNYMIKLGDKYNDLTKDKNENLITIIIGHNKVNNIFNLTNKNNFIKGNDIYIYFADTIQIKNNVNYPILLWTNFGSLGVEQENINSLYLSKNFYYLYSLNFVHKLCFDWFNIKKKLDFGLIPQKILISLLNEQKTKANGYYYQVLNFNDENNDYLLYYSYINSIYYELEPGKSHIFLSEHINVTVFDYYYMGNSYINYMIYPSSGILTILFYVEYLYDIGRYINILKFLEYDDSIYSLNLNMNNSYLNNRNLYNNINYLVFQCLSCCLFQSTISFKYNNRTYTQDNNNDNNIVIKSISSGNVLGYINLKFFNNNIFHENLFINIIKPYKTYIKYYYSSNINENYIFQNNYNINVEKDQNQNIYIVSFDCFLKNVKTNYSILILNKTEIKNEITNECEFFSYLDKRNDPQINLKYVNFIDYNINGRIKKEISFDKFGNYGIYILAQSLDSLSIYKYLGTESYTYTKDLYHNSNNESLDNKNQEKIAILIFIILIIILIILFIVFRYVRKKKLIKLFNSLNNSLLSDDNKSSHSNLIEFNNLNDISNISNINSINPNKNKIDNNCNKNNDDNNLLFEKPQIENENEDNNNENRDLEQDLDPELLGQSPAPLLGNTFCSEEDRIKNELSKINDSSNDNNKSIDKEKTYINTSSGYG